MPESSPSEEATLGPSRKTHNARVLAFMVILSFSCALILSILASALAKPKEQAKDLERSKQMMIAAKLLDYQGRFLIRNDEDKYIYAKYEKDGLLTPGTNKDYATNSQILDIHKRRIIPMLVNEKGGLISFEKAGINPDDYLSKYKKSGYYAQPFKLIYKILPNTVEEKKKNGKAADGYVIPINGFGLWDAIYGYLALKPDGNTVIGITWYEQKETPGLGANIAEEPWQSLFPGKVIFQPDSQGRTDFKTAPLGIKVVKGKVSEVLGDIPKAKNAVDGMAGATLTGNGVTDAYSTVLNAYRPFLIKLHENYLNKQTEAK